MPPRGLNGRVARTKYQRNTPKFAGNNPWNFDSFVSCTGRNNGGLCKWIQLRTDVRDKTTAAGGAVDGGAVDGGAAAAAGGGGGVAVG